MSSSASASSYHTPPRPSSSDSFEFECYSNDSESEVSTRHQLDDVHFDMSSDMSSAFWSGDAALGRDTQSEYGAPVGSLSEEACNLDKNAFAPRTPPSSALGVGRRESRSFAKIAKKALVRLFGRRICLVTNLTDVCIDVAHVIPRKTPPDYLNFYEYMLGFPYGDFRIDSRLNMIFLEAGMHVAFSEGDFVLLPSRRVIHEVREWVEDVVAARRVGQKPRHLNEKWKVDCTLPHQYRLVPFDCGPHPPAIMRYDLPKAFRDRWDTPETPTFTAHVFPFNTLEALRSHACPAYVVIRACLTLEYYLNTNTLEHLVNINTTDAESAEALRQDLLCLQDLWSFFDANWDAAQEWASEAQHAQLDASRPVPEPVLSSPIDSKGATDIAMAFEENAVEEPDQEDDEGTDRKRKAHTPSPLTSSCCALTKGAVSQFKRADAHSSFKKARLEEWAASVQSESATRTRPT